MTADNFSDKSIGGIIRGVALWVMMGGAAIADGILWWRWTCMPDAASKLWLLVWAIFWACIIALVIGFEIYGKFFSPVKITISNMWRDWITYEKDNKKFPWGRVTLIILCVALNALIVHLWFF